MPINEYLSELDGEEGLNKFLDGVRSSTKEQVLTASEYLKDFFNANPEYFTFLDKYLSGFVFHNMTKSEQRLFFGLGTLMSGLGLMVCAYDLSGLSLIEMGLLFYSVGTCFRFFDSDDRIEESNLKLLKETLKKTS